MTRTKATRTESRGAPATPARAGAALAGLVVAALLAGGGAPARAAGPDTSEGAADLDALVAEGLAANRALRGERLALRAAEAAVTEAAAGYLPTVTVNARLSDRTGRITDFGALVNPAFGALNQLLGRDAFPTDVDLRLPQRQETSLRVAQPILEPRVPAAWRIRAGQRDAQRGVLEAAERRLAADLRVGYLQYARALRLAGLYDSTLVLVNEAVRVQEALLAEGKATPDQVLRARADRSEFEQKRLEAGRLADAARQAMNARLGRPIDAPLERLAPDALGLGFTVSLDSALASARAARGELAAARGGVRAARGQRALADAGYWPSLVGVVDWGVQGERYDFGRGEDYRVASLVLQWTLFNGGQREAQRARAVAELERARTAARDAAEQVDLDVRVAWQAAAVSREALASARARLAEARRTHELVARRHALGAASLLEMLDARTAWTAAAVNEAFTTYDHLERCAELDRAAALDPVRATAGGPR